MVLCFVMNNKVLVHDVLSYRSLVLYMSPFGINTVSLLKSIENEILLKNISTDKTEENSTAE